MYYASMGIDPKNQLQVSMVPPFQDGDDEQSNFSESVAPLPLNIHQINARGADRRKMINQSSSKLLHSQLGSSKQTS